MFALGNNLRQFLTSAFLLRVSSVPLLVVLFSGALKAIDPPKNAAQFAFMENKGQFRDMAQQPVPQVLFRAETPEMKVWVTEEGLTYAFTRFEKGRKGDRRQRHRVSLEKGHAMNRPKATVHMAWASVELLGARIDRQHIVKEDPTSARYNFFLNDPNGPVTDVHAFTKITVRDVYPGIDWVLYGDDKGGFKYDFVVHPGADASSIRMVFDAEQPVTADDRGGLVIRTSMGSIQEAAPVTYLQGKGTSIANTFTVKPIDEHRTEVGFALRGIDPLNTRVIDPQITWNTLMACDQLDGPFSICTNSNGDVITTGYEGWGTGFPLGVGTGSYSGAYAVGSVDGFFGCFLRAFSSAGVLLWSTVYQGAFFGQVYCDANDRILAVGQGDTTFAVQAGIGTFTGAYYQPTQPNNENMDMCIAAFAPGGVREWATFFGGRMARTVTTDPAGNIIIVGNVEASDVVVQAGTGVFTGAYSQPTSAGALEMCILGFSPNGTKLWATYFGGNGDDATGHITTRPDGRHFIAANTGSGNLPIIATGAMAGAYVDATYDSEYDGAVIGLAPNGALEWCTYFGASNEDVIIGLDTDQSGRIIIGGLSDSPDLPLLPGTGSFTGAYYDDVMQNQDAYIVGFEPSGARSWTTFFGRWQIEGGGPSFNPTHLSTEQLNVDKCGNILFAINTVSADMPIVDPGCGSSVDPVLDNNYGWEDVFLMRFTTSGALNYSTYIGGGGGEFRPPFTIDPISNVIYLTAETYDQESIGDFQYINPGGGAYFDDQPALPLGDDAFIMKLVPTACETCTALTLGLQFSELVCNGDCDASATVNSTQGQAPFTYTWSNGQTTATATGLCAGMHSVTVTDADGQTSTLTLDLPEPLPIVLDISTTPSLCESATGTATVNFSIWDSAYYDYQWDNGQLTSTATGLGAGEYVVVVTDTSGCTATDTVRIIASNAPTAAAIATPTPITAGESVQLVGLGGTSYQWSPSTGLSCTTCPNPIATPTDTTEYCVTAFTVNGCSDTACVQVVVLRACEVFVPNAFSPNASGRNDQQCVYGDCISSMVFRIYDRLGNRVFETTDAKICWDGLHNGEPLNPGVFVYVLNATLTSGETVERQGNITLVR